MIGSYLIFDAEIKKAIQGKNEERIQDIEYCDGWHDHENMEISVMGAYSSKTNRYHVYMDDNKESFIKAIEDHGFVIGFNSIAFDSNLVKVAWGYEIPSEKHYDILVEIWKAKGLSETFQYPTHIGFGLDAMCQANFKTQKTGHGAKAPVLWQQGKVGEVIDYCLNDIALTKQLFEAIIGGSALICPKDGELLQLRKAA